MKADNILHKREIDSMSMSGLIKGIKRGEIPFKGLDIVNIRNHLLHLLNNLFHVHTLLKLGNDKVLELGHGRVAKPSSLTHNTGEMG